jgi:tRNA modification GTPase
MLQSEDTIAAQATPPGDGGIAVIRISGPGTYGIADRVFQCDGQPPSLREPYTFAYGRIHEEGAAIDECIMLFMRAPKSFTGEDAVEIQSHGGALTAGRILGCLTRVGARPAEPGEFTRRAFLNGKMDLVQAEAVGDLIRARSDRAAVAAYEQLEGRLSNRFNSIYDQVLEVAAELEATLDFPEEEVPEPVMDQVRSRLDRCREDIASLSQTWHEGHVLREGALVVISGRPNVGKSTLLNLLLGRDRAIVTEIAGTTRDTLEEGFVIGGIPVRLVDTAGLRDTECEIEQEGIRRAEEYLQTSDIQIVMIDTSIPANPEDIAFVQSCDPEKSFVVLNKCDLRKEVSPESFSGHLVIEASLTDCVGLGRITDTIEQRLTENFALTAQPHAMISQRHYRLLSEAADRVNEAIEHVLPNGDREEVIAASALRSALDALGRVTGRVYEMELLDSIFSRFCIGK